MKPRMLLELALAGALLLGSSAAYAVDQPTDDASVEKAKKLLLEVSKLYSKLPALTDSMMATYTMEGAPPQELTTGVRMSGNNLEATNVALSIDVFAIDGVFYLQFVGEEGSEEGWPPPRSSGAVKVDIGDDPIAGAKKAMEDLFPYLPPQLMLRWSDGIEGAGDWFSFGLFENPEIAGYAMIENEDGAKRHEILFTGKSAVEGTSNSIRVNIDPETMLLSRVTIDAVEPDSQVAVNIVALFKPTAVASLDSPIVVELGDATLYANFGELAQASMGMDANMDSYNPTVAMGAMAPEFDLVDQNGVKHSSSAYRGKIMMLDWWGVW